MINILLEAEQYSIPFFEEEGSPQIVFSYKEKILSSPRDFFVPLGKVAPVEGRGKKEKMYLWNPDGKGKLSLIVLLYAGIPKKKKNRFGDGIVGFYTQTVDGSSCLFLVCVAGSKILYSVVVGVDKDAVEYEIDRFITSHNLSYTTADAVVYGYNCSLDSLLVILKSKKKIKNFSFQSIKSIKEKQRKNFLLISAILIMAIGSAQFILNSMLANVRKEKIALQHELQSLKREEASIVFSEKYLPFCILCKNVSLADVFYTLKPLNRFVGQIKVKKVTASETEVDALIEASDVQAEELKKTFPGQVTIKIKGESNENCVFVHFPFKRKSFAFSGCGVFNGFFN